MTIPEPMLMCGKVSTIIYIGGHPTIPNENGTVTFNVAVPVLVLYFLNPFERC